MRYALTQVAPASTKVLTAAMPVEVMKPLERVPLLFSTRVLLANALGRHRTNSSVGIDADDDGRSGGACARSEDSVAESLPENDFAARIRPIVRRVRGEGDHQRAGAPSRPQKGLYLDESRRVRQDRPRLRAEGAVQPDLHPIVARLVCCSGEDVVEEAVDTLCLPVAPLLDAHEHDPASVKLHLERLQSPRAGLLQPGVSRPKRGNIGGGARDHTRRVTVPRSQAPTLSSTMLGVLGTGLTLPTTQALMT